MTFGVQVPNKMSQRVKIRQVIFELTGSKIRAVYRWGLDMGIRRIRPSILLPNDGKMGENESGSSSSTPSYVTSPLIVPPVAPPSPPIILPDVLPFFPSSLLPFFLSFLLPSLLLPSSLTPTMKRKKKQKMRKKIDEACLLCLVSVGFYKVRSVL